MTTIKISHGFTLIEMLVVIAIIAILSTIAMPSYSSLMAKESLTATANELVSNYKFARSEAIKRNSIIKLSSSTDGSWVVTDGNIELKVFSPSTRGVVVTGLVNLNITATGQTQKTTISLKNHLDETMNLCIFPSGQSLLQTGDCA